MRLRSSWLGFWLAVGVLTLGGVLAACGPATPFPAATPSPAPAVQPSATPEPTRTAAPTATPQGALPPRMAQALATLEAQVRALRGVSRAAAVRRRLLSPEALAAKAGASAEVLPAPDLSAWQALGLLPSTAALPKAFAPPREDTLAFFDPDSRTIFLTAPHGLTAPLRLAYVHAYARALQFQAHALPPCGSSTERCLAQAALAEGDAIYTEYLWLFTDASDADRQALANASAGAPTPQPLPPAWMRQQQFPVHWGFAFVYALFQRNGWETLDRAFASPPRTTLEILHPERYPAVPPEAVHLPAADDLTAALGASWRETARGEAGEWLLYQMFTAGFRPEEHLEASDALAHTDGWRGGAWAAFRSDKGKTAFLADVRWESTSATTGFVRAFVRYARARFGPLKERAYGVLFWETPAYAAVLRYDSGGHRTVWAFAPTRAMADALLAAAGAPGEQR